MKDKVIIKQFKNKAKKPVAGLTPEHAIYDKNGVRLDAKLGNVNLQEFRDLQQQGVNAIKSQETKSIQTVADREAEILAKSDAAEISFNNTNTSFSGTNVQDVLEETDNKLSELESKLIKLTGIASSAEDAGAIHNGDIFYNTDTKLLRKCNSYEDNNYDTIPFLKGAIYQYNNKLYTWNGSDLVTKDVEEALSAKVQNLTEEQKDIARKNIGAVDVDIVALFQKQNKTATFVKGAYIKTDSLTTINIAPIENSAFSYSLNEVNEEESWVIKGQGGDGPRLYCVTDANYNVLLLAGTDINSGVSTQNIIIPKNGKYIIVNSINYVEYYAYSEKPKAKQGLGDSLIDYMSQNALTSLYNTGQSLKRTSYFIDGYFIKTDSLTTVDATPISNPAFSYSINDVNEGEKWVIKGQGGDGPRLYCITDENYNVLLLAGTNINVSVSEHTIIMPSKARYLIVNSITASEHNAYALPQNDRLVKSDTIISIAAYNSSDFDKASATFVCKGKNDEDVINQAIASLTYGGKLIMYQGDYYVDKFDKTSAFKPCAILVGDNDIAKYVMIEGVRSSFPNVGKPTRIIVSDDCYNSLSDDTESIVIGCESDVHGPFYNNGMSIKDIQIELPNCNKPVICISSLHAIYAEYQGVICYNRASKQAWITASKAPTPHEKSVGFYGINSNNSWYYMRYWECLASGFGTAYKVGGDHITMINCGSVKNIIGYSFGAAENIACQHHVSLINCCSETDAQFMKFVNGVPAGEPIIISNFQIEYEEETAVDVPHKCAEDNSNYEFVGEISYASMPNLKFFEDGCGKGFRVTNLRNKISGSTNDRPTNVHPHSEFYDETLHKKILWDGENWRDMMGNIV